MKSHRSFIRSASCPALALVLLAGIAPSTATAQPSLTWIGTPLQVVDASADGAAIIGTGGSQIFTGTDPAFYWSTAGGLVPLATNGTGTIVNRAALGGMSANGQVIFGWLYDAPAYNMYFPVAWNASAPTALATFLTPPNATGRGQGGDISADGTRIASLYELSSPSTTTAFIRNSTGGAWTPLDTPSSQRRFLTVLVSRSGQHAAGAFSPGSNVDVRGYLWSSTAGFTDLGVPANFASLNVAAISDQGTVVAGSARAQNPPAASVFAPMRWEAGRGFVPLPLPAPAITGIVSDLTGDGVLASGHISNFVNFIDTRAVIWTPQSVVTVAQLAADAGINTSHVQFLTANVIGADGSFIIGTGSRRVGASTLLDTYILRNVFIPRCDGIDFNRNGVFPEDQDVIDFFNVLAGAPCPTCNDIDFNNNTVFPEDQDVIDFFNVLAGGVC
jgi:hypothetical protein